jgi:hypothetical protein
MSTRSRIAVRRADGTFESIYCHFDGYPEGVGRTLAAHYTDPAKVERLVALGAISVLAPDIGEPHGFETHDEGDGRCLAYGRDRGDRGTEAHTSPDFPALQALATASWGEYLYVFADGAWQCYAPSAHTPEQEDPPWTRLPLTT